MVSPGSCNQDRSSKKQDGSANAGIPEKSSVLQELFFTQLKSLTGEQKQVLLVSLWSHAHQGSCELSKHVEL